MKRKFCRSTLFLQHFFFLVQFKSSFDQVILIIVITLQKEIEELRLNLANISSNSDDGAKKLKDEYLQKLNALEAQVCFKLPCFFIIPVILSKLIFCFTGCRVEEKTGCPSSTLETETKKWRGSKTATGWDSKN